MKSKIIWLALLLVLLSSIGVAHAQRRVITGKVEEAITREPIPGVTVMVQGTAIGTITEIDGTFVLEDVPPGEVTLEIASLNYRTEEIPVEINQTEVTVSMSLSRSEEIVIIGRAPQITRQNLANGASVVKGDEVNEVSAQTVDGALQGRISGANIQSNSGAPGGGIQIKLRGVSTINGESSPLFVVDGVLISNESISSGIGAVTASAGGSNSSAQDNAVNRAADLNPNDIESIEILKGPAAAALYGSKATNGVVIITTKRGRPGETKVSVTQRLGTYASSNRLGSRMFETFEEAQEAFGDRITEADYGDGALHDGEVFLTNDVGVASETAVSMSGGSDAGTYYGSINIRSDPGIIENTGYQKQSMRLNLNQDIGDRLKVAATANLIHSDAARGVTNNDNASISHYMVLPFVPNFYDLRPYPDGSYRPNPFVPSQNNILQTAALMDDSEEVWRLIGSASANLRLWQTESQSVNLGATVGVDRFQQTNRLLFPTELTFTGVQGEKGIALDASSEVRNINVTVNGVYNLLPAGGAFQAATTVGFVYEDRDINSLYVQGRNLFPDQTNVHAAQQVTSEKDRERVIDRGVHLQQEVRLLDDRLTLLGAILGEQSSVNGDVEQLYFYPKAAITYRLPVLEEVLELVRPRFAYGETGNKPQYGFKFTPIDADDSVESLPSFTTGGVIGDENIEPERQREFELGIDAVGFEGRGVIELTAYQRNIEDLILNRVTPPSIGSTLQRGNFGSMRNRGIELMFQATPVKNDLFTWLSRTTFSLNRAEITGLDIPAFETGGFGTGLGAFRIEVGASPTQIVGNTPDGVMKLGDAEPDFRMTFVNNFTIVENVELTTLLDWQQGSSIINLTRLLYDSAGNSADFETAGMARISQWNGGDDARPYIEDASFLKLREVSLAYSLPEALVAQLGPLDNARLSLSGRNLLTFTQYSGLDPEVSNFGAQTIARNIDVAPYPPSRSFWFTLEANF